MKGHKKNLSEDIKKLEPILDTRQISRKILSWHKTNERDFPWRQTTDAWSILIAEILLRQTSANKVAEIYDNFIKSWQSPFKLLEANISELKAVIYPLGLAYRAEEFIKMSEQIVRDHNGIVPNNSADLLKLKGVGGYTTSAILSHAYNKQEPTIDTNILRFLGRLYNYPFKRHQIQKIRPLVIKLFPKSKTSKFNYALLDFCSIVCKSKGLICSDCPIKNNCLSTEKIFSS